MALPALPVSSLTLGALGQCKTGVTNWTFLYADLRVRPEEQELEEEVRGSLHQMRR